MSIKGQDRKVPKKGNYVCELVLLWSQENMPCSVNSCYSPNVGHKGLFAFCLSSRVLCGSPRLFKYLDSIRFIVSQKKSRNSSDYYQKVDFFYSVYLININESFKINLFTIRNACIQQAKGLLLQAFKKLKAFMNNSVIIKKMPIGFQTKITFKLYQKL